MENSISRKEFLTSTAILGLSSFITGLPDLNKNNSSLNADPGLILKPDEGEVYLIGKREGRITIKISKQTHGVKTMSLLTEEIKPDDGIPVHKHSSEEEFIYIEKGKGIFTLGDQEYQLTKGSMALVPRNSWHGLRNESDQMLRMVFGYTPAGFEDYFRAIGVKPDEPKADLSGDDWSRINKKYGVVYRD